MSNVFLIIVSHSSKDSVECKYGREQRYEQLYGQLYGQSMDSLWTVYGARCAD